MLLDSCPQPHILCLVILCLLAGINQLYLSHLQLCLQPDHLLLLSLAPLVVHLDLVLQCLHLGLILESLVHPPEDRVLGHLYELALESLLLELELVHLVLHQVRGHHLGIHLAYLGLEEHVLFSESVHFDVHARGLVTLGSLFNDRELVEVVVA